MKIKWLDKYLHFILFLFQLNTVFGQVSLQLSQVTYDQVIEYENEMNSLLVPPGTMEVLLSPQIFPEVNKYNLFGPVEFKRNNNNLDLLIEYYFSEADSLLRFVYCTWKKGGNNVEEAIQFILEEQQNPQPEIYLAMFEMVGKEFTSEFGEPSSKSNQESNEESVEKELVWDTTINYAKLQLNYSPMNYIAEIQAYYYWK